MKAVIFDLDGTLVDSAAAICANANVLMDELGLGALDVDETKRYVGNGARRFLELTLTARGQGTDGPAFEAAFERLQAIYAAQPGDANKPYPGVPALLSALNDRDDLALGLCTNKPSAPTEMVLAAHGWLPWFGCVVAGDTLAERKPNPLPLTHVASQLGATVSVYVGDSEVDAATAEAADVPFVLFTPGYRKGPVDAMKTHSTFSDYAELPAILDQF